MILNGKNLLEDSERWAFSIFESNVVTTEIFLYSILAEGYSTIIHTLEGLDSKIPMVTSKIEANVKKYPITDQKYSDELIRFMASFECFNEATVYDIFIQLFDMRWLAYGAINYLNVSQKTFIETYEQDFNLSGSEVFFENEFVNDGEDFLSEEDEIVQKVSPQKDYLSELNPNNNILYGRDREIKLCIEILNKITKRNILLVGQAGVGKTKIVESLPNYIDKKILHIDVNKLVSGTKFRGDLEKKLEFLIKDFQDNENIVLFFDEAHVLINGAGGEDGLSILNVLKEPMARGKLQVILATTNDEFNRHLKKDKAFVRRVSKIQINQTDEHTTIKIMQNFAASNNFSCNEKALKSIYDNGVKYLNDLYMPDAALEILDCAYSKVKIKTAPTENVIVTLKDIETTFTDNYDISIVKNSKRFYKDCYNNIMKKYAGNELGVQKIISSLYNNGNESGVISFLLNGEKGMGKKYLATLIANELCNKKKLIINASEYTDKISINKLIGASAGYVGYSEGGLLTNYIHNNPNTVIIVENIELAHPSFIDLFSSILENGVLLDGKGDEFSFENAFIFFISSLNKNNLISYVQNENVINLEKYFTKSFSDAITNIINFDGLLLNDYKKFAKIYSLKITSAIIQKAFNEKMTARNFKNLLKENKKLYVKSLF